MPELADVEGWRRYVARYAAGRRVRSVRVRDDAVLRNTSPQGLGRALEGARIGAPERRGKWLILPADSGHLVLHFGMTGALRWTAHPDENPPGDADRVVFALDGGELRYQSWRKLGGVWWVSARDPVASVTGPLGPDAADLSLARLRELLDGRRGGIKSALMDQKLVAGIGNELSDEILWRARLSPRERVEDLCRDDVARLHRALRSVLRRSIAHGRIPTRGRWLQAVRSDAVPACPRCGTRLRRTRVAGRSACWCPRCQR